MSSGPPVRKLKQSLLSFATHGRPGSFWPKAELSSKQSKAMQNRAQTKAEARRTDVTTSLRAYY